MASSSVIEADRAIGTVTAERDGDGGTWPWGQRALTRISELETLSRLMEGRAQRGPDKDGDATMLAESARQRLQRAREAVERGQGGMRIGTGARIDQAMTNTKCGRLLDPALRAAAGRAGDAVSPARHGRRAPSPS